MEPIRNYTFRRVARGIGWRLRRLGEYMAVTAIDFLRVDKVIDGARQHRLKRQLRYIGKNSLIRQPTVIELPQNVSIGDNVTIGSFVHMWGNALIEIGDRTMIAAHVAITTVTHDPDSPKMNETLIERPVKIGNDVWIGAHAIIFPGVEIGEHAVIAAGATVRDNVEPYAVVAGLPAKLVRHKMRPSSPSFSVQ